MSVIETIEAFDKLEYNDIRSFAAASALIAKSIQEYNGNPAAKINIFKLLYENESSEIRLQQKDIEREWLENNNEIISFTTILDSCLDRSLSDRPKISEQSLYLPFRSDQPIEYESIQWQADPSSISRFVIQPLSPSRVLQPRNEPNTEQEINNNNTNVILLDDNDDQNYVDANGDEENEAPKSTKKKGKKKKQQAKMTENNNDTSTHLNTSSNRTSMTGQKFPQKLSSKWSTGKRISGFGTGKTSAIRKFARPSNDRQHRPDSRTLFRNKPSVTSNTSRLSQEQREQLARAVEERKQEERKRKVEKLHEQAKKREEVLNRAKQIQQDKDQKNQLRVSDNQSKTNTIVNKKAQGNNFNNSTTFNNSMNESTNLPKTTVQQQQQLHKPVILDTTSNKILGQTKILKQPANFGLKKATTTAANAEYTFVVDKSNPQRNDITLPSCSLIQPNAQHKADWTISPTPTNAYDELELDATMTDTTHDSGDGDYGIEDVRSDQDSDNDDEDETRIPSWAKERLFQTFWKTQGHWYLSRRTLKLTRRTLGHYPVIKDQLQAWLKELKSSKPLSETFTDATYLDQTQTPHFL
ncbi:unnamed protein product [Rotaria sp. Silwood2]|nr:unnamed protein product [Rotaria sp. Silwood2]CAF2889254.1 unnamed protein product [Rotaria sp. Silwood2]CAF3926323.1 unnamed protein product [Rotaria sp. Silwood2]CAF3930518.1 unnamed protein product [Rotaria sp. Silwood2]